MALLVFNTLTRRKEEFVPRQDGKVSMYVCGPTVYNHIHVGNARAFIVFDVIRRYLRWRGYDLRFVQNYTDVDDKIIARAQEDHLSPAEVAMRYSRAFEDVMDRLGVRPPDVLVKATDHIAEMVEMIRMLLERGFAYESGGSIWFAVEKFSGYGKLSGRRLQEMRAGERVEPDPAKHHPLDFALWKAAKQNEPSWSSPWGPGRPGWHIECSAMSHRYLGMGFDIHGGGSDLIFPHHENEIAQAEAALGEDPFVRYWIHNGMVNIDREKMGKSLGNFVLLKDLLKKVPSQVVRLMALAGHYRSDVDFGEEGLEAARSNFERFRIFAAAAGQPGAPGDRGKSILNEFREAMDDDFNTPEALRVIHELIRAANSRISDRDRGDEEAARLVSSLAGAFAEMTGVLGVSPDRDGGGPGEFASELIDYLVELRSDARAAGDFEKADAMRARLESLGVVVEDQPDGTRWRTLA